MLIVTGGAGFIGSNLVAALNQRGINDILLVDNLKRAEKLPNLVNLDIFDYMHKQDFIEMLDELIDPEQVEAVFHLGACSDTMELDGDYMMQNNYTYSRNLLSWCQEHRIAFIYASSAAVYGVSQVFSEDRENEGPLNVYGYSKFLFDQYVRKLLPGVSRAAGQKIFKLQVESNRAFEQYMRQMQRINSQVVGLRYFNVYGPNEVHKGRMASVAWHHYKQLQQHGYVELFEGSHGYAAGEQKRDFIYVQDAVAAKLHFLDNPHISGIFNLGTGIAQSFNQLALAGVNAWRSQHKQAKLTLQQAIEKQLIRYKDFPEGLQARYQAYTCADVSRLHKCGFTQPMDDVDSGVAKYFDWLAKQEE